MFYKWRKCDFITVRANELTEGDEIAYGNGGDLKYGAIPLKSVVVTRGEGVLLQYTLPVGAIAYSSPTNRIAIFWQGRTPLIQISQDLAFNAPVLIRRK